MGEIEIIVNKDLPVPLGGFSILGGKGMKRSQAKELPPASAKGLQINAISIFGGCAVSEE